MDELISKEVVIDTLKAVRDLVWEVDIPSPTVPEYIEHHEQMQSIMRNIDILTDKIIKMPSAQPEIIYCKDCKHRKFVDFGMGDCLHPSGCRGIAFDNHFCALGERRNNE